MANYPFGVGLSRNYPETIILEPESEEFKFLVEHSALIDMLANTGANYNEPTIELSATILFQGDQTKWQNFVDLFFPQLGVRPFFGFKNNTPYVLPNRGGEEAARSLLDFFMVNTPETIMNFAKQQARKQPNRPSAPPTVRRREPGKGARAYEAAQARRRRAAGENSNNNYFPFGNNTNLFENKPSFVINTRPEIKLNNNGEGNNTYEENNRGTFENSSARPPSVSFEQLLALAGTKKNKKKKSKKGGSRHRRQSRRYKK